MYLNRIIFSFFLLVTPLYTFAGDFDGSKALYGSVEKILEINKFNIKDDVNPDSVGLPQNFVIDFEDKIIRPSKDSLVRKTSRIKHIEHIENKLILQGIEEGMENVDDGLAWSIAISKKSGKVVLSAAGDGIGYVVFGRCRVDQEMLE